MEQSLQNAALLAALVPALTPRRWHRYLDRGGDPVRLARGEARYLARHLGIGVGEASALGRRLARADPATELAAAREAGATVICWGAPEYPAELTELPDPPPTLFMRGELLACDRRAVAVVGARRATPYGTRIARSLAGDLARAGVTIVSGLARGVDAAAHEAALAAGGRTIAVLGSGLLDPYPPEHEDLLERVVESGAVLSEFSLRTPPRRLNFPRRNRVVAALGLAVLVVEAAARSGAMSTASHALDLGRAVLAVPGPVDRHSGHGTLRLLQEGAHPIGSAQDVFAALGWCQAAKSDLPPDERRVLDAVRGRAATPEDIADTLAIPEEAAAGLLLSLELRHLVQTTEGGKYAVV